MDAPLIATEIAIFGLGNAGLLVWKLGGLERGQKDHGDRIDKLENNQAELVRGVARLEGREFLR